MAKKTTIRMTITPGEVEASLRMVESLGGSIINRKFSSIVQQLFLSFLVAGMQNKGLEFLPESEAAKVLKVHHEDAILTALPPEEIHLIESKVKQQVTETRMRKIKDNLQDAVKDASEPSFGSIFNVPEDSNEAGDINPIEEGDQDYDTE